MIARIWRGQTSHANASAYIQHVTGRVFPALLKIKGYRGAYLLRRDTGKHVEFQVLTMWESMQAIAAFAGEHVERAVVEPRAQALLSEFDQFVRHYELIHETVIKP